MTDWRGMSPATTWQHVPLQCNCLPGVIIVYYILLLSNCVMLHHSQKQPDGDVADTLPVTDAMRHRVQSTYLLLVKAQFARSMFWHTTESLKSQVIPSVFAHSLKMQVFCWASKKFKLKLLLLVPVLSHRWEDLLRPVISINITNFWTTRCSERCLSPYPKDKKISKSEI